MRNNKPSPDAYLPSLSTDDDKLDILGDVEDPRVNFVCVDPPHYVEHIDPIKGANTEELDKSLEEYVSMIIQAKANLYLEQNIIQLPEVL